MMQDLFQQLVPKWLISNSKRTDDLRCHGLFPIAHPALNPSIPVIP
jgi:hypothetical protein